MRGTSSEKLNNELGWLFLYDRRTFRRVYLHYKIQDNLTPAYLNKEISPDWDLIYNLRRPRQVSVKSRTGKYTSSFFPHCMRAWENPSILIKMSPSVNIFKKRYHGFYKVESSPIYRIHDPSGLKYLTRLRLGLSHIMEISKTHRHHVVIATTIQLNPSNISYCIKEQRIFQVFAQRFHLFPFKQKLKSDFTLWLWNFGRSNKQIYTSKSTRIFKIFFQI